MVGVCLTVVVAAISVGFFQQTSRGDALVGKSNRESLQAAAVEQIKSTAELQARRVQSFFVENHIFVRSVNTQISFVRKFAQQQQVSAADLRSGLKHYFQGTVESMPDALSLYIVADKDVFAGADADFVNDAASGSNAAGRLSMYFRRGSKGQVEFFPLEAGEYENSTAGEGGTPYNYWYTCPRETRLVCILEPYPYKDEVTGEMLLVSSISMPILDDGKVIGVLGVDIRLQNLQDIAESVHQELYQGEGHITILSNQGLIAGWSRASDKITAPVASASPEIAKARNEFRSANQEVTLGDDQALRVVRPFKPVPGAEDWSIVVDVPLQALLKPASALDTMMTEQRRNDSLSLLLIAVTAILFGLVVIWFTARGISSSINRVAKGLEDISSGEGDLTRRLDEIGRAHV